ncbi:MAG: hypothetical protein E7041_01510 [Lentisphaerae bacterium]|nr:hypothetical protein [Lentisphaerota bacterium]
MKNMDKKMMFLVPGMVLGAMVTAAEVQIPADKADNTEVRVNLGRQQVLFDSSVKMRNANEKAVAGDFDGAITGYREVISTMERFPSGEKFRERIAVCKKRIAECYQQKADAAVRRADKKLTSNDFEDAIKICTEAIEYCPERREELQKKIEFYTIRRNAALEMENAGINKLNPKYSMQEYEIQLLLEQGRTLAGRNQLVQARRKFEEALLIDPFNEDAIQNLHGINNRIRKDAKLRAHATARRMTGKVEWDGAIPIVQDVTIGTPDNQIKKGKVKKVAGTESKLAAKMNEIIIPNFDVEEVTFEELMKTLSDDAMRFDKSGDAANRGVNFVVKLDSDEKSRKEILPKPVSISKGSVYFILESLKHDYKFLDYTITDNAVLVAPIKVQLEKMETRVFPYSLQKNDNADKFKRKFNARGIAFGKGSSVKLVPQRNHVIVTNTPANLDKVGEALEYMREAEPMVQVMFKFIEVAQSDLDELGFNWAYSSFGPNGKANGSFNTNNLLRHYDPSEANDRYSGVNKNGQGYEYNSPVYKHTHTTTNKEGEVITVNEINEPEPDADATVQAMWYDRRNLLSFSVYALDWADSSDILYSPRVTTLSGTTAKIDMSELHYYPDEWETIDTESNNDFRIEVPIPQPDLSYEKKLGVWFEITPKANRKTGLIEVPINIPITQFAGWMVVDTRTGGEDDDGEYIRKPIFTERSIKTHVIVKDGETVLIGGVTQDLSKSIDDKVPILGDIPFIGRFFQSKYVNSQKNHLLVFMTCRMIKPDGAPLLPAEREHGLPEFPRTM